MPEELHSSLSPSGRHRWGACPGSVRLEAPYPNVDSAASIDGTRTHSLLERAIKFEFGSPTIENANGTAKCGALPFWNEKITDDYGTYTVDADRSARLNVALDWIRDFVDEHGGTVLSEQRVYPDGLVGRADMHGTVDVQIVNKRTYVVMDYKDGMAPVDATRNPQLVMYALGVLAGLARENHPKKFLIVVCQPKLKMKGSPVISTWEVTPDELLAMVPGIIAEAAATEAPDAPLVPGEAQCKYCKAKGTCSALARQSMEGLGAMFSPVSEPHGGMFGPTVATLPPPFGYAVVVPPFAAPSFLSSQTSGVTVAERVECGPYTAATLPPFEWPGVQDIATRLAASHVEVVSVGLPDMNQVLAARDPNQMSDGQLRQLMEAAPLVNQLLDGVKKEIERRLHAGKAVPGFKLVQGNGRREWALSEEEMAEKLTKSLGIPKSAIYISKLVSPAQAEKLVWDKKGEATTLSANQKKKIETEYVRKIPGSPVVASESDPRPAIVKDASALFSPVVPSFLSSLPPSMAAPLQDLAQQIAPAARPSFL